jgi:hypothetical protein
LYVEGDPINRVDPSGLCAENDERCLALVNELATLCVNVIWNRQEQLNNITCLPEQVVTALQQAQAGAYPLESWTANEVQAVLNAFRVFEGAHSNLNMSSVGYPWPLGDRGVFVEKREYVSGGDYSSLGLHTFPLRLITLSSANWGEGEQTPYDVNEQIRSWIVLHEFSHIFVKDRTPPGTGYEDYATSILPTLIEGQFGLVVPTAYATVSPKERAIEAVTGTLWNKGYTRVSGFTSAAGGRTAPIKPPVWPGQEPQIYRDTYGGVPYPLTNVRDIEGDIDGEEVSLEQWIINNVILRNP